VPIGSRPEVAADPEALGTQWVRMSNDFPSSLPDDAPAELKTLWPLVLRWGESDDDNRGDLTASAASEGVEALVRTVDPHYPAINAYLQETGDTQHAVPYGSLAQAAMEARLELDRRAS
jgi:hypothetical protein